MLSSDCYGEYETCRPSFIKKKTIKLEYKIILHFKSLFDFHIIHFQKALSNRQNKMRCELWGDNLCIVNLFEQNIPDL